MASSRRLSISSLLCDNDTPPYQVNKNAQHPASRPPPPPFTDHGLIVPETVVLAPHLRSNSRPTTAHNEAKPKDPLPFSSNPGAQREDSSASHSPFKPHDHLESRPDSHFQSGESWRFRRDEDQKASRPMSSRSTTIISMQIQQHTSVHRDYSRTSELQLSNQPHTSRLSSRHSDVHSPLPPMKHAPSDTGRLSSSGYVRSASDLDPSHSYHNRHHAQTASVSQGRSIFGLDALVHAASEERLKIGSERSEPSSLPSSQDSSSSSQHRARPHYSNSPVHSHDALPGPSSQQFARRVPAVLSSSHIKRSISDDTIPRTLGTLREHGRGPTQPSAYRDSNDDKEHATSHLQQRHSNADSLDSRAIRREDIISSSRPISAPEASRPPRAQSNVYKDLLLERPPSPILHARPKPEGRVSDPVHQKQAYPIPNVPEPPANLLSSSLPPPQANHPVVHSSEDWEAQRPNKKRRLSSSPSRAPDAGKTSLVDRDTEGRRSKRERKQVNTRELELQRNTSLPPRRSSDSKAFHLLSEHEGGLSHSRPVTQEKADATPRQARPPPSRRLPPGSSEGRDIAAKKLLDDGGSEPRAHTKNVEVPVRSVWGAEIGLVLRAKEDKHVSERVDVDSRQEPLLKEEDADDWFLRQLDEGGQREPIPDRSRPSSSQEPVSISERHLSSPIIPPAKLNLSVSPPPAPEATSAVMMSDVEQELVDAVGISEDMDSPNHLSETAVEADVDLAVAEALGEDTVMDDANTEVDDELLRLVDDQPSSSHRLSSARASLGADQGSRPQSPSGVARSHASTPDRESIPAPSSVDASKPGKKMAATKGTKKPRAKPKPKTDTAAPAPAKPRAKPKAKSKLSDVHTSSTATSSVTYTSSGRLSKASAPPVPSTVVQPAPTASSSRSRSNSVMPSAPDEAAESSKVEAPGPMVEEEDDDKLYCICKTSYDEEKVMIACDRCDDWYHTQCVHISDVEVDLVDQFICPPCIRKNPELNLKTTYKTRCLNGLRNPDPNSASACHKPVHAFSKYCSETCGLMSMKNRIQQWKTEGGRTRDLWEAVQDAEQREGVVYVVDENEPTKFLPEKPKRTRAEREAERLDGLLKNVLKLREELKSGLEIIEWRAELLRLASERAAGTGMCGWDQRLCYGEKEFEEDGEAVLLSYEQDAAPNDMDVDGYGQWWCSGEPKCGRHYEWQKIRRKDIELEQDARDAALSNLTLKEREIRKRIEDNLDAQSRLKFKDPFKNVKKVHGEVKKGKKRKSVPLA